MSINKKAKEKTCAFYASDYHFEMITLPYIERNMEKEKKVIILTENNLKETANKLIERINLNEEKKKKLIKIDWNNNDLNKFKQIKNIADSNEELIILVKGTENYIKNINKNITKWTQESEKIKIIDCYDMEEIGEKMDEIMEGYKNVLSTTGERKIEKI